MFTTRLQSAIGVSGLVVSLSACGAASPNAPEIEISHIPTATVAGDQFQVEDVPVALPEIHPAAEGILPPEFVSAVTSCTTLTLQLPEGTPRVPEGTTGSCEVTVADLERQGGQNPENTVFWHTGQRAHHHEQLAVDRWRYQTAAAGYPSVYIETPTRDHHPRAWSTPEVKMGVYYPDHNLYLEAVVSEKTTPLTGVGTATWQDAVQLADHLGFLSSPAGGQDAPAG